MKKRILTKALSVMLCGTAVAQTGLSMTTPIMVHAETPDENGVLITNPIQTISFYDMFGDAIVPTEKMKSISYSIINNATTKSVKTGVAKYSENYRIDTSGLPKVDESGATINYSVKLWMPDGIEKDEDKSTATHLAIKVEKRYSHRKVWLQLLQRNGNYLLGTTPQQKYEIKLTPPDSLADDNRFKEKIIRVDANREYTLTDRDEIFETDKLGNKINYKVDINPTPTDSDTSGSLTYLNERYDKKEPSMWSNGTYIIPYVRINEKETHFVDVYRDNNTTSDFVDDLIIQAKEIPPNPSLYTSIWNADTPLYEFRIKDIPNSSGWGGILKFELPKFNEKTDNSANYAFRIRGYGGDRYYISISPGTRRNKMSYRDPDEIEHRMFVIKRVNRVTLKAFNYNWGIIPRRHFVEKMPKKIKAKIKKNGNVLDEIELTTDSNVLYGMSNMQDLEYMGNSEAPLKIYFKKYDTTADDALTAKTIANPDVDSVTVRLKNGETVTLTKENGYTLNLTGKPKYDTNDNAIDYGVDHVDVPNGYELLKIEGNKDIVLRAVPEHYTTTISTNFKSYNDNPFKGSTEDYINVTIFRTTANITDNNFDEVTGEEVKKVMLSKSDGYSVTLTDLPKTNPDGEAYHYFIKMDNITGFEKTYTKTEADSNLTLGVTHKRPKEFTTRKVKIKFVNKDGSVIACNPINKIKITIYRNGDKLDEKDVTITNAETDIVLTGLLYHEEESNYNGRLYHYEIVPSPIEGFNEVTHVDDDGFSSVTITYTSIKKLDTPCTDLPPDKPIDEPTPPKKEVIPWTDLVPANPIEPVDPDPTVPNKDVIPWTDLVPATPIKPDTPSTPTEPEKKSVPWTDLVPATPINDTTPVLPVIPTVPEVITTPLIPVIQPVTETVTKPAVISESSIVTPVEPKVTTESGVQVVPDTSSEENTSTKEKPVTHKTEPKKEVKQDETLHANDDDTPITDAKIKRLKELQRQKELREKLKRAKIRKTLPRTGGTNVYYYMVPGGILMLTAMGLMLKRKKKK